MPPEETIPGLGDLLGQAEPDDWDRAHAIPKDLLVGFARSGLLCAEVDEAYGGRGLTATRNGELTAAVGEVCGSLRSILTSQGMAASAVLHFGSAEQRAHYLPLLATSGALGAVAFSEPEAGSDLSAMETEIAAKGDSVFVTGQKRWVTAGMYADHLVVFGRHGVGGAAVVVPADASGVTIEPTGTSMGFRASGHAVVSLDEVELPRSALLARSAQAPLSHLAGRTLVYGRLSVAWGGVGIVRACLAAAARHAIRRTQFGLPIARHQLVARRLAELRVAEHLATLACLRAGGSVDARSPAAVMDVVLAKHVAAREAVSASSHAMQVIASAGVKDDGLVARAYRDAKMLELIEGTNEMCELMIAEDAVRSHGGSGLWTETLR
ncbi:acyl-CoA dehydrogenase [Amycolatopsis sp. WAC 04197]|uniref:acyl-CoA dehydrogenase family protein n=1 Tax=Amycolatopsis sp. WAC 04197 TaxID=2203199 RepID=UPI000F78926B|nr:acyl-CoA dehydrogenase family protein [Amycolatopsis sp. WAC 04197]RSN45179.1 acyl-CoA dehydrogenase [Amycolatopsis sp. WAC 04197]